MSNLPDPVLAHLATMLRVPEVPGGRYEVVEPVGQGGMGIVFRARDRVLDREVALKVLRPEMGGADLADRLRREAAILARLEHPGIVPVHDAGLLADGRPFYVMKLVRGARLDEVAAREPLREVLRRIIRVCETVGFAHARGVVHRDLKPANIMVGAFGEVLVLDWGIARVLGEAMEPAGAGVPAPTLPAPGPHTDRGAVLGTPGFMPPEQAEGRPGDVDARSDVFALGELVRALAGPDLPPPLTSICARAKAADPASRYPDVEALAADLTRFLDGLPVHAHRETLPERLGRLYARYQTAILLILAYLVVRFLFLAGRGL